MQYEYECQKCGKDFERSYKIGEAEKSPACIFCDGKGKRVFREMNFQLKGGGWPGKSMKFNKEMTDRNAAAGRRMRKEHGDGPVKTVAHDYGNGDVREVGK